MEFVPFYLGCLAHASYLVGDRSSGTALVVDPQRDVEQYLAAAAERGLTIRHVVLTHFHADFVAGHLALRDRTGAQIHLGAAATAEFPFTPWADGQELRLGSEVVIRALATPGHTPEGITLLVEVDERPVKALTGDTLFIGDVGRPDLLASLGASATDLASSLHASLARLLHLPDAVEVWPAHGAGSLCGKRLGSERSSTIGHERTHNWALQPQERSAFIAAVTADQPAAPAYFLHDVQANRSAATSTAPVAPPLSAAAVAEAQAAGAMVLDVRPAAAVAGAHIPGAIAIGLSGAFAPTVGQVIAPGTRLVLVCEPGREAEAVVRLGRIGYDALVGYLAGGMAAWEGRPVVALNRYEPEALRSALEQSDAPLVVDVRNAAERATGAIPGSVHLPLGELAQRWRELPRDRALVIHCAGGYRSLVAATWLQARGYCVADLLGGFAAFAQAGAGQACPRAACTAQSLS
jgi:glyoxylase-like metal-dependent hydrolase (beta-lactamase superfamily II)/rhodanese-related sulfurtransferase